MRLLIKYTIIYKLFLIAAYIPALKETGFYAGTDKLIPHNSNFDKISDKILLKISKSPIQVYNYFEYFGKFPVPNSKRIIATDAEASYKYAMLIDKPFKQGENAIKSNPSYYQKYKDFLLTL